MATDDKYIMNIGGKFLICQGYESYTEGKLTLDNSLSNGGGIILNDMLFYDTLKFKLPKWIKFLEGKTEATAFTADFIGLTAGNFLCSGFSSLKKSSYKGFITSLGAIILKKLEPTEVEKKAEDEKKKKEDK